MLVVITIGLISTAYIYFSTIVTVGPVVSSMTVPRCKFDATSKTWNITIYLKNEGIDAWNSINWLYDGDTLPNVCIVKSGCMSVSAGLQDSCMFVNGTTCTILSNPSGTHTITAIGPKNQVVIPVTC